MTDANAKKKIFLIDSLALIYRAHFAFINNPRINSKGQNTSAIFGFVNSLLEIIEKEKPTHIAAAFDSYEPTVRHEDFTAYKANRDKQPEDITFAIPVIKQILQAMNIAVLEMPGYEADDIIATLVKQADRVNSRVYMVTPDKDYSQLVDDHIFIYKPGRGSKEVEIWDTQRVLKEFGIEKVEQVIDIQSLTGDAVDNIPGVPGIGPKTAQSLINQYGSLENLLAHTHELKGKIKENLETYAEQARISYQLAKLMTDAPVILDEKAFAVKEWDKSRLEEIFGELEFKNLSRRMLGKEPEIKSKEGIEVQGDLFTTYPNHQSPSMIQIIHVHTGDKETEHIRFLLKKSKFLSLAIQYTDDKLFTSEIKAFAVSFNQEKAYLFDYQEETKEMLQEILSAQDITLIAYDFKKDIMLLKSNGLEFNGFLFDNLIAHYLIDSESSHDFNRLCENYLHHQFVSGSHPADDPGQFAFLNIKLYELFSKEIEEKYHHLFHSIEIPLVSVLAEMEYHGVKISSEILAALSAELQNELKALEEKVFRLCGMSFNLNSPQQLGHVLFNVLKLDPDAKKTKKSGQFSTNEEVLTRLAEKHEIAGVILEYREIQKLKSTYSDALPGLVNPVSGMIHTSYEQAVASTGRLSSRNPNLQNIPVRTERGRLIRKAFIPRQPERLILSADYSQIELRVVAHVSNDEAMIEAFRTGKDIHTSTAAKVFGVKSEEVNSDMRRKAKEVNFGIIYGISSWGLAQRLGISKKEASEIIDNYFKSFPGIKNYMQESIEKARKSGYAETLFGRRRYLRDINSVNAMQRAFAERNAINAPVQGTAADIIKLAMIKIHDTFKKEKLKSLMIMQVHDELVFDVIQDEYEVVTELVREGMENVVRLKVPLIVDIGKGMNWLDAH
ncbi:MAG TPA: DNA polymerase I [Bacteroidia bacterium]|nr:DNA polymerase I [Bacteroidia bacterium]HRS59810.1 DNA polymerase I [Bacteroidia bacterium]HRU69320.1 DNA polymerase I [Bacteroidia bacterium]